MRNLLSNYTFFVVIPFFLLAYTAKAQHKTDFELIQNHQQTEVDKTADVPSVNWLNKVNPLYWIYKGTISFYQKNISVQIAANCVFETTCSHYSKKLVDEFGIVGGAILSIERLSRCNRISLVETSTLHFSENGKLKEDIEQYHFK
ncbi:MAG: putative component of membrane protein insertase Oxa1/YidC/SpoIIIJ protein YidD [Marivirga sp.]|jgi:putative component of membrane protein insertase Oxa1/YidC/SpoIIIJ protein YidD